MTQVFRRKEYNLNETVTNELDFLLGAVFAQILLKFTVYCMNRGIKPSLEQLEEFNITLFSKASEFRDLIKSLAGL
jgi:hypothetical protein